MIRLEDGKLHAFLMRLPLRDGCMVRAALVADWAALAGGDSEEVLREYNVDTLVVVCDASFTTYVVSSTYFALTFFEGRWDDEYVLEMVYEIAMKLGLQLELHLVDVTSEAVERVTWRDGAMNIAGHRWMMDALLAAFQMLLEVQHA